MQHEVPESRWVFRTAAWVWLLYLVALAGLDVFIYAGRSMLPILSYHLASAIPALIFLTLAHVKLRPERSGMAALMMITLISVTPVVINSLLDVRLPPAPLANLEGMVLRQLPVLLLALVLVAWHCRLAFMVLYTFAINLLELILVHLLNRPDDPRLITLDLIVIVRTVSFLVVGLFINWLIARLRAQQDSLRSANKDLVHYASTLESLTVGRERSRMSRELHDTVVHTLSGLSVQLETARSYWDVNPAVSRDLIVRSLDATRSGLQETRRVIKALRAGPLDELGLVRALQAIAESAAGRGGLILDVDLPSHNPVLSPDVEDCIYRIAQESVENVVRHAHARHLAVELKVHGKDIALLIQDNGLGFNPRTGLVAGHFGITGMQERAQMAGAEFSINSEPNCGTSLRLVVKGCLR